MKKIIVLGVFLVFSITVKAQFYKVVLTFENKTKKTGLAKMVGLSDSSINFKLDEEADKEKISSEELKKIEYTDEKGNLYIAERFYISRTKNDGTIKKASSKSWFYVTYSKGLLMVTDVVRSTFRYNAINGTSSGMSGGTNLYLGKEKQDEVYFIYFLGDRMSINIGMDGLVRKVCGDLFKNCPKFLSEINKENFKKPTLIERIIEMYSKSGCK
jgi:hypothetical protein